MTTNTKDASLTANDEPKKRRKAREPRLFTALVGYSDDRTGAQVRALNVEETTEHNAAQLALDILGNTDLATLQTITAQGPAVRFPHAQPVLLDVCESREKVPGHVW